MTKDELIKELLALKISQRRIEHDNGMPHGNLNKYFKDPSRLPDKWFDKLITYVRLKKDVRQSDWGKLVVENEELRAKVRSLEVVIKTLNADLVQLRVDAKAWNDLIEKHNKVIMSKNATHG